MKNKFLLFLMLGVVLFAACNDDDDPAVPPTLSEIAGEYSGDKLTATINGEAAGENAAVNISRTTDTTATITLNNIVPDEASFKIEKAKFETTGTSEFTSHLSGEATNATGDLKVAATVEITNGVMTIAVTTTEIELTNPLWGTSYTGDMTINVNIIPIPTTSEQTVFIEAATNQDPNYINLVIRNFSFSTMDLGDINLENIELVESENGYTFEIADYTLNIPALATIGTITADANGSIVNENTLNLSLTIAAGDAIDVTVNFDGEKNAE